MADSNTPGNRFILFIGNIVLDDCNFHESVNYGEFIMNKALKVSPPEGEFVLMNYRITSDFNAPFKIFTFFET
jgi:AP-4 complex subunit mu-1